jgi:hypothetical protein
MSIFASQTTVTLEIPFDPGQTVTIRKLAGRHLQRAHDADLMASLDTMKRMGGVSVQKELQALGDDATRDKLVETQRADPMSGYDLTTLLVCGITAWSYPDPVTPERIDDLDEEAAAFLGRAILKLSKPGLFLTEDERQAVQKNG